MFRIIAILARFLLPSLKFFGRVSVWLFPLFAWIKRAFIFILNKLLVAYFGSRIWMTITMIAVAVTIVGLVSTVMGYLAQVIAGLFVGNSTALDSSSLAFLNNYISFDWLWDCLGFAFGAWVSYLGLVKSLVAMKWTHKLFKLASKAVK